MNPAFFHDNTALLALLERWAEHGWLRALDVAFASFLARETPDAPPLLVLAAALASHQLGRGHACLDLAHTLNDPGFALSLPPEGADASAEPLPLPAAVLDGVSLAGWQQALRHPQLVGDGPLPADHHAAADDGPRLREPGRPQRKPQRPVNKRTNPPAGDGQRPGFGRKR